MKSLLVALVLSAGGLAYAQASGNPPVVPVNPDQLFQSPLLQPPGKPQFKLQLPDATHELFSLQRPEPRTPKSPGSTSNVDPGILRKPQGFAQRPSRPAPHSEQYPGLKIQPVEIAKLEGASTNLRPNAEPIPTVFPKARLEEIPIAWDEFKMVPVEAGSSANR
jgi:hypothetical protein